MKIIISLFLILFWLNTSADNSGIRRLLNERENQSIKYQSVVDSVIPGRLTKMYILNNHLQNIVSKDDSIILNTYLLLENEARINDSINKLIQHNALLSFDKERLQERAKNDMKMLLILKIAVAFLLFTILVLIYFISVRLNKRRSEKEVKFGLLSGLENENVNLREELERVKSRELNLKEELDRTLQLQQDKYALLNEKYNQLFAENNKLKQSTERQTLVDDREANELIDLLKIENNNLTIKLNGMQQELNEAKSRNQSIMKKIEKLITDLSGVG